MPLQPAGQHRWASTVLEEEPQAPGYVVHKLAVWRPTVSMTISGVRRYSPGGNWVGQFPYDQGAAAAIAEEEETTLSPPADNPAYDVTLLNTWLRSMTAETMRTARALRT